VKEISSGKDVVEQEYQTSLFEKDYPVALGMPKVSIVRENLRFTST
jgi:hypothetical protein